MLDIAIARITHIEWENQLESLLLKKRSIITISDYGNCELGKWLYGTAIEEYESIPEIELLEKEHKLFHLAAEKVTKWHNNPRPGARAEAQAMIDFDEVKRRSKEIVYLLTLLEFKIIHKKHLQPQSGGSLGSVFKTVTGFLLR